MLPSLLHIGWANLWRNPRRTAITAAALALGTVMLAFVLSMMAGMTRDLVNQGTGLLLGHIQVHAVGYRAERSIFAVMHEGRALATRLAAEPDVVAAAPRVSTFGLVSSGEQSAGVEILGVQPAAESRVSELFGKIVAGVPLSGDGGKEALIGERLARSLAVRPGDELVVLTQATDGSLGNDLYRLAGVFRTALESVDSGLLVLGLDATQSLLALPRGDLHEIALRTAHPAAATPLAKRLAATLHDERLEVAAWPVLAPELAGWVAMSDSWQWISYAIVFALAAIAVLNTMLMSVFERLREFGVLAALGMHPAHIVLLVVVEVAGLSVVSLAAAVALGAPVLHWFIHDGLDLSRLTGGFTLSGVAFGPILRGAWTSAGFARAALLLIAFALLAGLYPAIRAARVDPAALTRGELQ